MKTGEVVEVREYGGNKLVRRVVADRGATVVICNEAEYTTAPRQGREPQGIGFPRDSVCKMPRHGNSRISHSV